MVESSETLAEVGEDHIVLNNSYQRLSLARTSDGAWYLSELSRPYGGRNWITASRDRPSPLWRARFLREQYLPPDEITRSRWDLRLEESWTEVDSLAPAKVTTVIERHGNSTDIVISWGDVALASSAEVAEVVVRITLPTESHVSKWSMIIRNRGAHFCLWEVAFPLIGGLAAGDGTTLIVPSGWGQSITHAGMKEKIYNGHYPSGGCVLQLICLTDGKETVYLAPEDKKAYHKRLTVEGTPAMDSVRYGVIQYPETMGRQRNSYETPYAVHVGVLEGDWYSAAKTYRSWAISAPWAAGGKIETRDDTAQWLKDNVLWAQSNAMTPDAIPDVVREVSAYAKYFGVPTAVHWYSWHEIPFDDHYPEYFPAKAGFREAVATLQEEGIHVMPYINGRLWDPRTESWFADSAADACTRDREQKKYVESYASKVALAAMCPFTQIWQNKIGGIIDHLAAVYQVDGVYVDQIGAAPPNLCFGAHGHAAGGGDFWVRGYETLLSRAKARGKARNPDLILTTEDAAEAYGAQIDAFLMCNTTRPDLVPLYPAIYSGIFLTFGRYVFEQDLVDPAAFRTKMGQIFLWGAQLAWMSPSFILKEEHRKDATFLRELARTKAANQAYLTFGELVRPPKIESPLPSIQTHWCMWNPEANYEIQPMMEISTPAVGTAAWRHSRGDRWGLFFVNMSEDPHSIRWAFGTDEQGDWQAREQVTDSSQLVQSTNREITGNLTVPGLAVRIVELFKE